MTYPDVTRVTFVAGQSLVVEEQVGFGFAALCRACGADAEQLQEMVDEGLLAPTGSGPQDWQFSGPSLLCARSALRLARELDLTLHAAAIVMALLAEIELLKTRR